MLSGGIATIYVSDMDRSVDFYSRTLGMKVTHRAGNHWCSLDAGSGLNVGLHPAGDQGPRPGSNGSTMLGLQVTDSIHDAVSSLQERGVEFRGPTMDEGDGAVKLAFFSDPDGNDLYLCEVPKHG